MVHWPFRALSPDKVAQKGTAQYFFNDVGNFVNHSLATLLRVVGKERHSISSRDYWRPNVVLKVLRWSLSPSNGSSWRKRNFERHRAFQDYRGEGRICFPDHSIQASVCFFSNGVPQFVHLLLISRRRSKFCSSEVTGPQWSPLLWLSPSSSWLALDWSSSYWSHNLIS